MTKEWFRSKVGGGGAVEQRLSKHACRAKRDGDQKSAEAAIAVQERMNGFNWTWIRPALSNGGMLGVSS